MTAPVARPSAGADHVLAIDLGGTQLKVARATRDGRSLEMRYERTARPGQHPGPLGQLCALVRAETRAWMPLAVGVVVPGLVEEDRGVVRAASNLAWRDVPLAGLLGEEAACPVALGHDVRAGAVAEGRAGAGRGRASFAFVAVGTGIAAAVVIGGRAWSGAHAQAGEVGHLVVRPGGEPCACGKRGCVEAIASAGAIARRYGARTGVAKPAQEVLRLALAGDDAALVVWQDAVQVLAEAVVVLDATVDPEVVIIGGGLSLAGEDLLAPLREACRSRGASQELEIVPAQLGDAAGWRGAAMLAWDRLDAPAPRGGC